MGKRQSLVDELTALSDDYVASTPTTPNTWTKMVMSSIHPLNKVIIVTTMVMWLFILYNGYRERRYIIPLDDVVTEGTASAPAEMFSTPDELEAFKQNQTFNGADVNSTVFIDVNDGVAVLDKQSTMGCYLFGLKCPEGQKGRGQSQEFKFSYDFSTYEWYAEGQINRTKAYSLNLADAMGKDNCKGMDETEADTYFCERGIVTRNIFDVAVSGTNVCKYEVDIPNCGVWKQCLFNIAKTHYSKQSIPFDGKRKLNDEGTESLDIPVNMQSRCKELDRKA